MQLRRAAWDLYVRSPNFVTQETSNNEFTILEPILPITSKKQVTYYPRITKKEKQIWPTTKQTRCSYEVKRIHIYGVYLGILPQTSPGGLRLWVILVFSISISTYSSEAFALGWPWFLSLSLPLPLLLCLPIQFSKDMCTSSVLHGTYVCIFNSRMICAQVLDSVLTFVGFVPTYSIVEGYVHNFLVFFTYEEVLDLWSIGVNNPLGRITC